MLILEFCQVVDIFIHHNVQIVRFVVGCHIGDGECFGHYERLSAGTCGKK